MCEGEIDFKELAKLYAKQKCDEEGAKPLTLPENKRGQKYIDNEISRELTDIHLEKSNIDKTPVVNEDEIKQKALEEAKKNFVPYLYPTLSGNGNTEKARIHKKIIGKILRILIAIILLTYAGFSVYKFVVLSQLIKKIKGLNNINNYYAEILEYNDTIIKEKNYVWYKDGMFKINKVTYDDSGVKKDENVICVDKVNNKKYFYKDEKVNSTELNNKEIYDGIKYVFSFLPKKYNFEKDKIYTSAYDPFTRISQKENYTVIKGKKDKIDYEKITGIPYCYRSREGEKNIIVDFKIMIDGVNDDNVKMNNNSL